MTAEAPAATVRDDERGRLVSINFTDLPFAPQRVFTVTAPGRAASRGGHETTCAELIVLQQGAVHIRLGSADDAATRQDVRLEQPGQAFLLPRGIHLEYDLLTEDSSILVLADAPYPVTG